MKLQSILTGEPVALLEMLDARSARSERQKNLLKEKDARCLISFSLNIAGEVKSFPLALLAFDEGLSEIRKALGTARLLAFEESRKKTGPEAFFLLDADPQDIKKAVVSIEESHPLGRLYDIDVLGSDGLSLSRSALGLPVRTCLICGKNAKACARGRVHSVELVLWRTVQLLNDFFKNKAADTAAACAVRALLYEVSATPKPGLVDRDNSGSHKDMDFFTFLDSSAALIPCFRDFFSLGWDHGSEPDEQLFSRLRFAGTEAEAAMFQATGGVNTHKGLIFSSAILCGALGKISAAHVQVGDNGPLPAEEILAVCRRLGECSLADFAGGAAGGTAGHGPLAAGLQTAGELCHSRYGIAGARGEAAAGFPSVMTCGLPALKHWLSVGFSLNDAAVLSLLSLLSQVDDTNMIHRGGREEALRRKQEAGELLSEVTPENFKEKLTALDISYISGNLSPGGCADLLAVSLMFYFLENVGMVSPLP